LNSVFRSLMLFFLLTMLFACDQPSDSPAFPDNGFIGCEDPSDPGEDQDVFTGAYPNPTVELPPDVGMTFVAGTMFPLKKYGYEQVEYFYSGTANSYVNTSEMKSDGKWEVAPAESAEYKTRMLIYRPTDMSRFNGTVVMEWYNVTGGVDTGAEWIMIHTELLRRGYIYVGISAQYVGVEGGDPARLSPIGVTLNLKLISPRRYESLSHPGDSFSYDIFAQAAQAIRHPQGISPLGDVQFERLIAMGESQSATRLLTFINAFGKKTDLFDGYFIHSRLGYLPNAKGASAPLSQSPQAAVPAPETVIFREDIDKPVMNVQTETDLFVLGAHTCRQPDNDMFRLWEIAGAAHADVYTMRTGMIAIGDKKQADIIITTKPNPVMECPDPVSSARPECFEFLAERRDKAAGSTAHRAHCRRRRRCGG